MTKPTDISIVIQAYKVGVWAFHRRQVRAGWYEDDPAISQWSVTHVPTGHRVTGGKAECLLDEFDAERVANALDSLVGDPPVDELTLEMVEACIAMALDPEMIVTNGGSF